MWCHRPGQKIFHNNFVSSEYEIKSLDKVYLRALLPKEVRVRLGERQREILYLQVLPFDVNHGWNILDTFIHNNEKMYFK